MSVGVFPSGCVADSVSQEKTVWNKRQRRIALADDGNGTAGILMLPEGDQGGIFDLEGSDLARMNDIFRGAH
jgi:hypothetical protein